MLLRIHALINVYVCACAAAACTQMPPGPIPPARAQPPLLSADGGNRSPRMQLPERTSWRCCRSPPPPPLPGLHRSMWACCAQGKYVQCPGILMLLSGDT